MVSSTCVSGAVAVQALGAWLFGAMTNGVRSETKPRSLAGAGAIP